MFANDDMSALEGRIVDGAGQLAAAQCRWLLDLAALDENSSNLAEFVSTAAWLSWTCGVQSQTAKEYVQVGKALQGSPKIASEFSRGRLSYFQVKLLVGVATIGTEQTLIHIARNSTIGQLSLVLGTYRSLLQAESDSWARHRGRSLTTWFDANGFFILHGRLNPEEGAIVESALRRAMESVPNGEPDDETVDSFGARQADALVHLARGDVGSNSHAAAASEIVVHVDVDSLGGLLGEQCHLQNEVALAPSTALRIGCDAALVPILEDHEGNPLSVGRRTRTIPRGLRQALRARDKGCRFPGCLHKRFIDGHHIRHWARGGETSLNNLVQLCTHHHRLVHEGGYEVRPADDGFEFFRSDGSPVPTAAASSVCVSGEFPRAAEPGSICSEWLGDRMNMEFVVGALFEGDP